ncbi:hypothetical protein AVEN_110046-1 [Araneus ventricosus]|uniref:Uncharacterized protein n=1 Tax=Araneus ventricosus TaxID=182803 RepID=A0A4Y2WWM3_ARAVE|nr:hypothetical protein AVEN_38759-1 [Araneus ventricosus]GBO41654.1 hypothetical protein AVEN_110046-1 [Araneus ventricosus]
MEKLKEKMDSTEYKKFSESYFTIRIKNRAWSGVAPDMIIEKCLMKSMKIAGGVTQGRGMEDSTLSRWVSSCPINMKVFEVLEEFCEKSFESSEQHVEFRPSRQSRDDSDLVKLSVWLLLHNPLNFSCPKHLLINIVQEWLGNNLDPAEWGWFMKDSRLNPVPSTLLAASEELLQLISCNCKMPLQETVTQDASVRRQIFTVRSFVPLA